jgi:hypothetical protein
VGELQITLESLNVSVKCADLDEAVQMLRLATRGDPAAASAGGPMRLENLGAALFRRYAHTPGSWRTSTKPSSWDGGRCRRRRRTTPRGRCWRPTWRSGCG